MPLARERRWACCFDAISVVLYLEDSRFQNVNTRRIHSNRRLTQEQRQDILGGGCMTYRSSGTPPITKVYYKMHLTH